MSFSVNKPAGGSFWVFSSPFCPWSFSFTLRKNAAKVPSASVTSLGQSDLPVEIITYDGLSLSLEDAEGNERCLPDVYTVSQSLTCPTPCQ